jgi:drug/metabolite transporter (DMT)-like permease
MPIAYRYALTTIFLWSTVATAFKLALASLSVAEVLFIASVSSATVLLGILAYQGRLKDIIPFARNHWRALLLLAMLNPVLYYQVLFRAYDLLLAQQAQAINYSWAICLSLLSVVALGQKMTLRDVAASVLAYVGVVVVASGGDFSQLMGAQLVGVMWALGSTLLWSVYWVLSKKYPLDPLLSLTVMFCFSVPMLFGIVAADGLTFSLSSSFYAALYVGVFEMGLSFVTWLLAMQHAQHVSRVANLIFLSPFLSLIWINGILKEQVLPSTIVGLVMILLATIWQQTQAKA